MKPGWVSELNREVLAWEREFAADRDRLIRRGWFPAVFGHCGRCQQPLPESRQCACREEERE